MEDKLLTPVAQPLMNNRLTKLRNLITDHDLDGILVTKPENQYYFSGFTGSAGAILVSARDAKLITDFRYIEQATKEALGFDIIRHGSSFYETVGQLVSSLQLKVIGFESDYVTWETYHTIQEKLIGIRLVPHKLDKFRMIKDSRELTALKKAVLIADQAYTHIITYLRPGLTENQVALELEYTMRRLGAEKIAFDIIVASGVRSSLPHGRASDKVIQYGDFVTMDFGAVYEGYHSDITRTVVIGKASNKQREIYNIVLEAQLAGVQALGPNMTGCDVDEIARTLITEAGYGNYFGHGLGHGVGLMIHEDPRLSPSGEISLQPGMTVTIEPGIYLPAWGGVRIEDMVVVTADGCDVLTASSKQLIELE